MLKIKEKELLFKLLSANNQVQTEVTSAARCFNSGEPKNKLLLGFKSPFTDYFWTICSFWVAAISSSQIELNIKDRNIDKSFLRCKSILKLKPNLT